MNIAMAASALPSSSKNGVGYQAHYMANALFRRGHSVSMFTPATRPDDAAYEVRNVEVGGVLRTFRYAWNLRMADLRGFDVFHAHGDDYWLWGNNKPVHVRTMHGSCFAEAANVAGVKERLRMAMLGISEVVSTVVADRTVCVSRNTQRYYPWVKDVIANGVDIKAFHQADVKASEPTILFVGTYRNRKRGKLLMEIFDSVIRPALPAAQLWMVCSDAPAGPGVTVFGRVTTQRLADFYRRAWVFCLPSSYEGFGVPYIEAMASGTPVVATPNVGAREVLADGTYGVLAKTRDLGNALLQLLRNDQQRASARVGTGARAKQFSWDRVIQSYEHVYRELLDQRRGFRRLPVTSP